MASTPLSYQSPGDGEGKGKGNNTSVSYFQKTVCLQDWWLIKAEKDGEGEGIGVAGFTSREQPALRLFASAPITKYYDMYTLETVDGICVVLKGLINKTRTLENGFPSEVFNHFVMGFPPFWEEFAENCLRWGSAAEGHSREDAGKNNLNKGIPENSNKAFDNSCHIDGEKMTGEVCLDTTLESVHGGTACSESSVQVPMEPEMNIDSRLHSKDLRISNNLGDDVILDGADMGSPLLKTTGLNNDTAPSVIKSVLVDSSCLDTGSLESSGISNRCEKVVLSFQKAVVVQCDKENSFDDCSSMPSSAAGVAGKGPSPAIEYSSTFELSRSSLCFDSLPSAAAGVTGQELPVIENSHICVDDTMRECTVLPELQKIVISSNPNMDVNTTTESKEISNSEFENLKSHQKERASGCAAKCKSKKRSLVCGEKRKSTEKISGTCALFEKPEKENSNSKSLNLPVHFGKGRNLKEAAMYSEGRILTRQFSKSKRKQDRIVAGIFEKERNKTNCLQVGGSDQTVTADAGSGDESERHEDGTWKTTKKACRSTYRLCVADKKHCSTEVKGTVSKDANTSAKKTIRKLMYESPTSKEGKGNTSIVSIESLSCKRSRSGRLLLPSLEFWRNQKLVYDADGQITGIKDDPCSVQPSRGSKSEPRRKKSKLLV